MAGSFLACLCVFALFSVKTAFADSPACIQSDPCFCRCDATTKLDLWPLDTFTFKSSSGNATYLVHFCKDYNFNHSVCGGNVTKDTCGEAAICICDGPDNNRTFTKVASNKDVTFDTLKSTKSSKKLIFKEGSSIKASVILACAEADPSYTSLELKNSTDYAQFILFSFYNCPINEEPGLSTGTALLIIFFFLVSAYFLLGALLLRFIRGARGIEMVPNLEFWRDLPYLVRDGIIFLLSGCKPTTLVTSEAYDRI